MNSLYRSTLTPTRAKRLISLARKLGITDSKSAKPGQPRFYQKPRVDANGLMVIRIDVFCTEEQKKTLSDLYPNQA